MKNTEFAKKLAQYVLLAKAILASQVENADAQILYTEVNPDLMVRNDTFFLDLNNDGVTDFFVKHIHNGNNNAWNGNAQVNPINNNQIAVSSNSGFALPLNLGDTIEQQSFASGIGSLRGTNGYVWHAGTGSSYTGGIVQNSFGHFLGDKYLGVKVNIGGQNHYGWIRLEVQNYVTEIKLESYAINMVPDSAIVAGEINSSCNLPLSTMHPTGDIVSCDGSYNLNVSEVSAMNVQWLNNGQWISNANDSNYLAPVPDKYEVLVSDSNCARIVGEVNVLLFELPTIHIASQHLSTDQYSSYQWYLNDTVIAGANSFYYYPIESGYYKVMVTDTNGCAGLSEETYFLYNSVENIQNHFSEFTIFVEGKNLYFDLNQNILIGDVIIIINDIGQQIATTIIENKNPIINLSEVSSGIYFYQLVGEKKILSGKFFLE